MRQRAGPPQNPPVEKRQPDESRASVYPAVVQERIDGGQRGRGHPWRAAQHDDELRADRERPEFRERERERSHGSTANFSVFHSRVVREDEGGTSSPSAIRAVILCERTSKASRRGRPPAFDRERERERLLTALSCTRCVLPVLTKLLGGYIFPARTMKGTRIRGFRGDVPPGMEYPAPAITTGGDR